MHGLDHGGEEIRRLHDIGGKPAALQERRQRALRLRPVDAVDRGGVIARDDQQPLDAGEPRLLVVIFGILGQIGDEIAVVGPRRRDLGEGRRRLVAAALAGGGDDEIVRRDAQRVAAVLRDRRGAVDAERARIQQDAVGGQRALQHHAAGGGIDPEPAPRRGRRLVVDADRGLDHIAHAVAEFQVGERGQGGNEQRDRRGRQRHQDAGQSGATLPRSSQLVMPGLDPGIHVFPSAGASKAWMAGSSPAMTPFVRVAALLITCGSACRCPGW